MKVIIKRLINEIEYIIGKIYTLFYKMSINVMTIDDTIDFMSVPGNSIARFGDGEFMIIDKKGLFGYQVYDDKLRQQLISAVNSEDDNFLVCMPEPLANINKFKEKTKRMWTINIWKNRKAYRKYISAERLYGNSFVSRPYMFYLDKTCCDVWFSKIISIFENKDITIIEGEFSRTGVGNDMFAKTKSLKRIICPPNNAFEKLERIMQEALKIPKNNLILLAIGPTSKPLALALHREGYWVLDIGHLDSEYEWYLKRASERIDLGYKHSAEMSDMSINECDDEEYLKSIISVIE